MRVRTGNRQSLALIFFLCSLSWAIQGIIYKFVVSAKCMSKAKQQFVNQHFAICIDRCCCCMSFYIVFRTLHSCFVYNTSYIMSAMKTATSYKADISNVSNLFYCPFLNLRFAMVCRISKYVHTILIYSYKIL